MSRNASYKVLKPFICRNCQSRLSTAPRKSDGPISLTVLRRFSSTPSRKLKPSATRLNPSRTSYVQLKNRSLIRLDGPDATDFLHNLIPAHVLPVELGKSSLISTALLNAKGRITHDIFVYKPTKENSEQWIIDVDANRASSFLSLLRKHKLRSKFKIEKLGSEKAVAVYIWPQHDSQSESITETIKQDPRPQMGRRGYLTNIASGVHGTLANHLHLEASSLQEQSWEEYMIHRMLNGHAEGPIEIIPEHALPQESNFDFYEDGIDFHKGCYLGQELTIRTHHTGVVRKRILPVQIYSEDSPIPKEQDRPIYDPSVQLPQPAHEANISKCGARGRSARSTGKFLRGYGNVGLALCRLEMMTDLNLTAEGSNYDVTKDQFRVSWEEGSAENEADGKTIMREIRVKAFVPPWLRQSIEQSLKARSERSKRRKRDEEDEEEDDVD